MSTLALDCDRPIVDPMVALEQRRRCLLVRWLDEALSESIYLQFMRVVAVLVESRQRLVDHLMPR